MSRVICATASANQAGYLQANSEVYQWLVERIHDTSETEAVLRRVTKAASFATAFHAGRFADGAIENVALEAGAELSGLAPQRGGVGVPIASRTSLRRVLHVASHIRDIGGHSRMLYHWMRNDRSSCHSLVVVNQKQIPIPQWLPEAIRSSEGNLLILPTGSPLLLKATWLREMARQNADLIVLHHDGNDVVPTIAFSIPDCPPVAVLNHADHQFWLGSSISDVVINLRTAGSKHTVERRYVSNTVVIPIPLADPGEHVSRLDARRTLGIPEDQIVLLSVGRAEKYRPCGPYDFIMTAGKILDRRPEAHVYVVGESSVGIAPYLRCSVHERLHFVGVITDASLYRAAADIYLETFPFGSQTALLEAALGGIPVVTAYAPLFPLLVANDDALEDLISNARDEQEYIDRVDILIRSRKRRVELGELLRKRLRTEHVREGWLHRLTTIYRGTDCLTHRPRPIPEAPCSITDADINLSLWHAMADGRTYTTGFKDNWKVSLHRHSASIAKYSGHYSTARRHAWAAVCQSPHERASWRLLATTILGEPTRYLRRFITEANSV